MRRIQYQNACRGLSQDPGDSVGIGCYFEHFEIPGGTELNPKPSQFNKVLQPRDLYPLGTQPVHLADFYYPDAV
jgi:hypothetical protein